MTLQRIVIFLIPVIVLCSCRSNKEKDSDSFFMPEFQSRLQVGTHIIVQSIPCNLTYGIWESGNVLCAIYFDSETETLVHLFDKHTGFNIGNYIHRGRGPLEMPPSVPSIWEQNETLYMSDLYGGKTISFNIQRLASEGMPAIMEQYLEYKSYVTNSCLLDDGKLLVLNNIGYLNADTVNYRRLEVIDENDKRISSDNSVPYPDPEILFYLYQQTDLSVSPDCQHLVCGSVWGGLLELYTLPDLNITGYMRLIDPAVSINRGSIELTDKTTTGIRDIVAKNEGFYAVIGADVFFLENINKPEAKREFANNDLYYFNWRGEPIKQFTTDYNLEKICVTESLDTLYSIVSDVNGRLAIGVSMLE